MTDIQRQTLKCGLVGRDFKRVIFFLRKGEGTGAKNAVEKTFGWRRNIKTTDG